MKLRFSRDFAIDTDDYSKEGLRIGILAMSGHGKSNAAADVVEDVLDNGAQIIIVEPIPEWHTLKARYNNVVVIGGPYQDVPLEPSFAHEYVQAALEKGISLVVNVSDIEDEADQLRFVSRFLWNLYRLEQKYRRVVFLVLEDADTWAPQQWDATSKPSLSRVSLIAKQGRKIGIFPILISQRPADLHKSPLSQCNVILFGKFTSAADLNPRTGIMYIVKKLHLSITEKQIMQQPLSHFIVHHKAGVEHVVVRKRLCPHGADTPLVEAKPFTANVTKALDDLKESILKAVAAKKEEQSIVKRQEKQIAELKKEVEKLEKKAEIKLSVKEMLEGDGDVAELAEKLAAADETIATQRKQLAESDKVIEIMTEQWKAAEAELHPLRDLKEALKKVFSAMDIAGPPGFAPGGKIVHTETVPEIQHNVERPIVKTNDKTYEGRLITLAMGPFFKEKKKVDEIHAEVTRVFGVQINKTVLGRSLPKLVQWKILQREKDSHKAWVYWLVPGAQERIKEAEA